MGPQQILEMIPLDHFRDITKGIVKGGDEDAKPKWPHDKLSV